MRTAYVDKLYLFKFSFLISSLFIVAACSSLPKKQGLIKNPNDPLINQIYSSRGPARIEQSELLQEMTQSDVIYLGENHDNTHHHNAQLNIIKALVDQGQKPVVGFEFFSRRHTSHLIKFLKSPDSFHQADSKHSAEKLLRVQLGWENRDADWAHLFPILKYAREQDLPVFGADLSPVLRKQLTKYGYDGLSPVEQLLVPASNFKDDAYREFMYQRFTQAHCGWRDDNYLQNLYATWLSRNETMARSIVAMHEEYANQPIVVVLGAGHTEYNMAVYERTAYLKKDIRQLNLRLQAVAESPLPASEYFHPLIINNQSYGAPFEYMWFTARMPEKEDPCKKYLKYKNKHAKKHSGS